MTGEFALSKQLLFDHLRIVPWNPTFTWTATTLEAAARINMWHEDYPRRVEATERTLNNLRARTEWGPEPRLWVDNGLLLRIHRSIFRDQPFAGRWRDVRVTVGRHRPPAPELVEGLMAQLSPYAFESIEDLETWYMDMETVHPFQDGNGRVGGVVVAAFSHAFEPEKGWMAPNQ